MRFARFISWLAVGSLVVMVCACADDPDADAPAGVVGSSVCERSGGHCLGHNSSSAKGQGPADCDQFGRWFHGGPLRQSPLSCKGEPVAKDGWNECCVR